jgi:hypothetical protein
MLSLAFALTTVGSYGATSTDNSGKSLNHRGSVTSQVTLKGARVVTSAGIFAIFRVILGISAQRELHRFVCTFARSGLLKR